MTKKGMSVSSMFSSIAFRYDFLNALLSFGRDRYWRQFTASSITGEFEGAFLDVATGTGDLAVEVARRAGEKSSIIGIDFCQNMLDRARDKMIKAMPGKVELICAQAELLPFCDNIFEGITIGFGLRNMPDIERALKEIVRVLKVGRRLICLEFSLPENKIFGRIYSIYLLRILPVLGGIISGNKEAYAYLPRSISEFPSSSRLKELMERTGLREVEAHPLTFGVVTVHIATKQK
jgi:demethylmenaquinone methyltransferase / 2-methoxy-6-polyprenyl-1,4-benzoquinol methylase